MINNAIYIIKKLISMIKVNLILLKSLNKYKLIAFLLLFFAIWILRFLNKNAILTDNIRTIHIGITWLGFVYFFIKLKKDNFFNTLIVNRGLYIAEFEILLFVISVFALFFAINIPFFPFLGLKHTLLFSIANLVFMIDALLFACWKTWKYIIMQSCFLVILTLLFIICYGKIDYSNFQQAQIFMHKLAPLLSVIEIIIIKKVLVKNIEQ